MRNLLLSTLVILFAALLIQLDYHLFQPLPPWLEIIAWPFFIRCHWS